MGTLQDIGTLPEQGDFFIVRQSSKSSSSALKPGEYVVLEYYPPNIYRHGLYDLFNIETREVCQPQETVLKKKMVAGEIAPLRTTLTNLLGLRFQGSVDPRLMRYGLTILGRTDQLARKYLGEIRTPRCDPNDIHVTVGMNTEPSGSLVLTLMRLGATLPVARSMREICGDELDHWKRLECSELSLQGRFLRYAAKYAYEDLTQPRQEAQDLYDMLRERQQPREVSPPAPTIQPPLPPEGGHAISEATLMRDEAATIQANVHGLQHKIAELEEQNNGLDRELRKERARTKDLAEAREELAKVKAAQQKADALLADLMSTHKAECEVLRSENADLKRQLLARSPIPQSTWDLDDSAFPSRRRFAAMLRDFQDGDLLSRMDFSEEDAGMLAYGSQLLWDVCDSYVTSRINEVTAGILQVLQLRAFPEYMAAHMRDAELELMRANWQQLILPSAEVLRGLFDSFTEKVHAAGHVALRQCVDDAALTRRCIESYIQLIAVTKLSKPPIEVDDKRVISTVEVFNRKLHTTVDGVACPMVMLLFPAFLNIENIPVLCASTSPSMLTSR